jgi:4-amino-4-deoxy-L-arabinose transferase-like glycosyltransferase
MPADAAHRSDRNYGVLCGVVTLLGAGLILYSRTAAFAWDEGFHLLTAQLIGAGKRPYLDFCFPQTPVNAYWNAGCFRLFGDSWRTAHTVAALLTCGAVMLTADYLFARFPVNAWRFAAALTAALTVGLNAMVVQFGTIGQAYGLCLFLIVAAFRFSIVAVERKNLLWPAGAGFLASAAAMSSLLTMPVAPVLAVWMLIHNRAGNRWNKFAGFIAGAAIPLLPLLWLFAVSPRQVIFGVIQYNLLYRQVHWEGAIRHDLEVMVSWLDSSQALMLGLLAAAGLLFIHFRSGWDRERRAEFYLCAWLAAGVAAIIGSAHPTFERYFLLTVPFLAILAAVGVYAIGSRMVHADRPLWPVFALAVLLALGLAKSLYDGRNDLSWRDVEEVASKVDEVTPAQAPLLADENVYFVTRRRPPSGMELADSHRLEFPPAFARAMHIVSRRDLDQRIRAGEFSTVEMCEDDETYGALGLRQLYAQHFETDNCAVFWDKIPK